MKILLVYPKFPDTFWSFNYAVGFIGKKAAFPPLGLLSVAALLPEQWSKRLVDENVQHLTDADILWADMVFIGAMAVQRKSAGRVIEHCGRLRATIVAGGPLFTSEPDAFNTINHLVLDEAELTLPAFLSDLEKGNPKKIYRAKGFSDLVQTPGPLWDLLETRRYASLSIQFSRGCPFNCDFCNVTALFGHRPRLKTPAQIISELDQIYSLGW
ncbi:MAG: B12-binding domain-containing radical SAM protein, partial [Desulfobacteraceae bacterium]